MTKYIPPGFNAARVIDGIHKAMGFGEPNQAADVATFYFPELGTVAGTADEDGVPFDPDLHPDLTNPSVKVYCAIEYADRGDETETFGTANRARITLTLLDPDYQQVKGFAYVTVGGVKYAYRDTAKPDALGSIDVWTVTAETGDQT